MRHWRPSAARRRGLVVADPLLGLTSCTRCALSLTRHRVVVGSGPARAALVVIGEAPGRNEDEGGAPFVGRSGTLLFTLIKEELGLSREQCFVTNVVKCRPPANRPPKKEELSACRPWWEAQIASQSPRVIMTLGNTATRAVLGQREPIGELHGRVHRSDAGPVVPTYHPAAALRGGPNVVAVIRRDLQLIATLLGPEQ